MSKLAPAILAATLFSAAATAAPPDFAPTASTGWFAYARVFIPPAGGAGPVPQDPAHPLVSNDEFRATGKQATFPMGDPNAAILQPWAREVIRKTNETILAGKPMFSLHATCRPAGVTDFLLLPMTIPMYIVQGPKEVLLILEDFGDVRRVYLSAKHSPHLKPSWYGESIGHYDGDTLVVDTIGIAGGPNHFIDNFRTPHSDKLHVVERFTISPDAKSLTVIVKVEDPDTFNGPLTLKNIWRRNNVAIEESVCADDGGVDHFQQNLYPIPVAGKPDF